VPEHEYLELLMTQAVRAERDGGDHAALRKYGAVQTLLAEVADQVATATLLEQGHPLVSRCRFALLGRLADPDLTVKSLAEELRCHPDTLSRLVRAEHGISLNRFIRRERLQHAAHLLATSEVPVKSVAYSVGFADAGYFSRCFSRDYHCSPLAYRHRRQSSEE
jgi:transcriptional regulator GlxA family with amidase domain